MRHFLFALLLSGAASAVLAPVARAGDLALDDVVIARGASSIALPHVVFSDANITADEARTLFSQSASAADKKAVLAKLKAAKIVAPRLVASFAQGRVTISNFEADDIEAGKAAHASFSSATGSFAAKPKGAVTMQGRAMKLDGVDFSSLFDPAAQPDRASGVHADAMSWAGFDLAAQGFGQDASNAQPARVGVASMEARSSYQGGVPVKSSSIIRDLTVTPPPGSPTALVLKQLGYDAVDLTVTAAGTYDPAARTYSIDDLTVTAARMGAVAVTGEIASLSAPSLLATIGRHPGALGGAVLRSLNVSVTDAGLFNKVLAWYAARADLPTDAMRRQWAAAATVAIPLLLRGAPASLTLAQAVSAFIQSPKELKIQMKAKGDGASLGSGGLAIPNLLSEMDLDATALN